MFRQTRVLIPMLAALTLCACSSEPEWMEAYKQCKETVQSEIEELNADSARDGNDPSRAMVESMGKTAMNMALTGCEMIRTACEQDEDGPTCRAYVEQAMQR